MLRIWCAYVLLLTPDCSVCDLAGFVGDGNLIILVDAAWPPQAPQGEAGGRLRARWMGWGRCWLIQLHPCCLDACHGFAQECRSLHFPLLHCVHCIVCTLISWLWVVTVVLLAVGLVISVLTSLALRICIGSVEFNGSNVIFYTFHCNNVYWYVRNPNRLCGLDS
jgi:hypothetical protein